MSGQMSEQDITVEADGLGRAESTTVLRCKYRVGRMTVRVTGSGLQPAGLSLRLTRRLIGTVTGTDAATASGTGTH